MIAEGPAGRSAPSQELAIKTEPQRPAGPPLNLSARPMSPTDILVAWTGPLAELRHGEIQGYNIGYKTSTTNSAGYNFSSVSGDSDDAANEFMLTGLSKFTRYTIVVQAFNQVGVGPLSEPISSQTLEDVPSKPPEDIRCAALNSESMQVSWQPPPSNHINGILQGYKTNYELISEDVIMMNDDIETRKTTALTIILNKLRKFSNYSVQILAYTRIGDGVPSKQIYCQTEQDVPEAPADIKVVVSSPQSLYISWLPPNEPNGEITRYNLYTRTVNGREELNHDKRNMPSTQLTYEAKGLKPHMEYQFWVTASTRIGEGKSSRVASQITSTRVPARVISFGKTVIRPWRTSVTVYCHAVGQPRREWYKNEHPIRTNIVNNAQFLDSGEMIISSLQMSDTANYSCTVENGVGTDRITHNLIVQVPPIAPELYVSSATSSSILMHWKLNSNGNAPITMYKIHYRRTQGNTDEITLSRHATSHELKGLLCGTTYNLFITAHNKIGSSPESPVLLVRTQGQSPAHPDLESIVQPNSTSVTIRLHMWGDNGCPILYFGIQYRELSDKSDNQWKMISNALKPQRKFIITGLTPTTIYQLKLEAHNVAGVTNADYTFITLTKDGGSHSILPFNHMTRFLIVICFRSSTTKFN